jgi:hypothetical protein
VITVPGPWSKNNRRVRYLSGENLTVDLAEFSTLSWTVLLHINKSALVFVHPFLELKTRQRVCPVNLSLSMK